METVNSFIRTLQSLLETIAGVSAGGSLLFYLFLARSKARRVVRKILIVSVLVLVAILAWEYLQ